MNCPKCGKESASNVECSHCGIIFSKYYEAKEKRRKRLEESSAWLAERAKQLDGDDRRFEPSFKFSLFGTLDFTFSKFYTSVYVRVLYVLYLCLLFGGSIAFFITAGNRGYGWEAIIVILVAGPIIWLLFRVSLEAVLILFRIEEHLRELVHTEYETEA